MQRSASGGPSKYRGVIWHKSNSKWEARIYENGKQRFLGYYASEEEAARVYDEAAARITGRAVNFPDGSAAAALVESLSRANSASDEPLEQGEHHLVKISFLCRDGCFVPYCAACASDGCRFLLNSCQTHASL